MKNILILCDDYYPSSRATIAITQRFSEALVENGYNVKVITIREKIQCKPDYVSILNGVEIFDYSDLECSLEKCLISKLKKMDKINKIILKFIQKQKKLKVNEKTTSKFLKKWNMLIDKIRLSQRKNIYDKRIYKRYIFHRKSIVDAFLKKNHMDTLVSVALPFSIHHIAFVIKSKCKINWIPINFDPYAYDEVCEKKVLAKRKKEEEKLYSLADKVFFLSQFSNDYRNSDFLNKVVYFELANIRPLQIQNECKLKFDSKKINCVFIGNLFLKQRHPEYLFKLIDKLSDQIVVSIVGGLVDISKDYIDEWVDKLSGKLIYCERVSQKEAMSIISQADVLINIGNLTTNQCPSKLIDYISTGKPIVNIAKIEECTSVKCLEKYPLKFLLSENEEITEELIFDLNQFLKDVKNKKLIPYDEIEKIYSDFTMKAMIDKFIKKVNDL